MVYEVIVDVAHSELDKIFDYTSPYKIPLGSRVLVPFGHRQVEGFVLGTKEKSAYETKDVIMILDEIPSIIPELLTLTTTLVKKYNFRYIDALRLFVPPKLRGGRVKIKTQDFYRLKEDLTLDDATLMIRSNALKQKEIIDYLAKNGETSGTEIRESMSGVALQGLVQNGIVIRIDREVERVPYKDLTARQKVVTLTEEQQSAVDTIENGAENRYLIHGVTGSGKTEIYLRLIEDTIKTGKTAIMLVPEISLTPQMLSLFRGRFGDTVGIIHSKLSDGERYDEWRKILLGDTKVVLGPRSALFSPLKNIGIIIIDEEHDGSYVSENQPKYTTEDIAVLRAEYNHAKLVLGSATPSLESYKRAVDGESVLIKLKNRVNSRPMPKVEIVSMGDELRSGNNGIFSAKLISYLEDVIDKGEQAMIFLNRRGFSKSMQCKNCGYVPTCPDCDIPLTHHKFTDSLECHYCGKKYNDMSVCPICGSKEIYDSKVRGTENVVAELNKIFPSVKVLRMDNDTTTTKDSYLKILEEFRAGKAQILVGTQMIAKGHDFPNVTLVGIIEADISLFALDFRSVERTFQLITQVAGRAGRDQKEGKVVLQTFSPKHYVFRYVESYDYEGFYAKEDSIRRASNFPPYSRLIRILITTREEGIGTQAGYFILSTLLKHKGSGIYRIQAMEAPIRKIDQRYRSQVMILSDKKEDDRILPAVYQAVSDMYKNEKFKNEKELVANIDINPQQMT